MVEKVTQESTETPVVEDGSPPVENAEADAFEAEFTEFATEDTTDNPDAPLKGAAGDAEDLPPAEEAPTPAADDITPTDADDTPASKEPVDIWANATPEQKAAHEAAETELARSRQDVRSNRGRVSALQRKLTAVEAAKAPAPEAGEADTSGLLESDEWKTFETDYPEVAAPVAKLLQRQEKQITALTATVGGIAEDHAATVINAEEAYLAEAHPDWESVTETPEFSAWFADQPRYVQEGFARNGNEIVDGAEASTLIALYKDSGRAPTPEPSPDDAGGNPENNGLDTRRKRRLEAAVTNEGGSTGPGQGPPNGDFDAAFNHFADQP